MTEPFRFVIAQLNPRVGDLKTNTNRAIDLLREHGDVDLVIFGECFLSGYPLEDMALKPKFIAAVECEIARLTAAIVDLDGPAVLIGAPIAGPDLPYNAAIFIRPDGTKTVACKFDRPNEGVFDEVRTFAQGALRKPVVFKGHRLGIGICEEMWKPTVASHLSGERADLLIFINGSPYARGKHLGDRMGHARARVRETGIPLVYVNLVGGEDELVFDGASFILDADGGLRAQLPAFREASAEFGFPFVRHCHDIVDYPQDLEADYAACVMGLRDYVEKSGRKSIILGMSGGIDSALAGAIAVDALGSSRVRCLTMPSRITSDDNVKDAYAAAQALGVRCDTLPIGSMVDVAEMVLAGIDEFDVGVKGVTKENLQARMRMVLLMAASNQSGPMLISTGNKSELSVGYATLYGDMSGGFNPLKDLYKTEVWRLARWRNQQKPFGAFGPDRPIPENIITKPPSAELATDQTDEATLGPYPVLDALLVGLVDHDLDAAAALKGAIKMCDPDNMREDERRDDLAPFLTLDHARKIAGLLRNAEWKRRQAAPGIKIGSCAFGRDRRYPIVNAFEF